MRSGASKNKCLTLPDSPDRDDDGAGRHRREERPVHSAGGREATPAPLLDNNNKLEQTTDQAGNEEYDPLKRPSVKRKRGRLYFYLKSGLAYHQGETIRFLTLTSADDSPADMMYSFKRLVQEIRRLTPQYLINSKCITLKEAARYYAGKPADEPLEIEYCGCRTNEGNGVIHVLITGDYIPFKWLQDTWKRVHGAFHVNVQRVREGTPDRVAGYCLGQYITNQDGFVRMVVSSGWLYPGARKEFKALVNYRQGELGNEEGFKKAVEEWTMLMYDHKRRPQKAWGRLTAEEVIKQQGRHRKSHRKAIAGSYRYQPYETDNEITARLKNADSPRKKWRRAYYWNDIGMALSKID